MLSVLFRSLQDCAHEDERAAAVQAASSRLHLAPTKLRERCEPPEDEPMNPRQISCACSWHHSARLSRAKAAVTHLADLQ